MSEGSRELLAFAVLWGRRQDDGEAERGAQPRGPGCSGVRGLLRRLQVVHQGADEVGLHAGLEQRLHLRSEGAPQRALLLACHRVATMGNARG